MPVCDGCRMPADDAHIRRRIERLELATRFRPIHIQLLLIDAAPPTRTEDYFYRPASNREERSKNSRHYFDEIVKCSGFAAPEMAEEAALAEFQHRGFYLACAVECPVEPTVDLAAALQRAGPVLIRRIEKSYKPKYVALLSSSLVPIVPLFERSELRDRLLLNHGEPFSSPVGLSEVSATGRAPSLSDELSAVLPHSI
jgi:hypothetical protein